MEPVKNVVFGIRDTEIGAPPGQEDEILPLPAVFIRNHEGWTVITSRFRPSPEERRAIAEGADVYLYVYSRVMVPVILTTDPPVLVGNPGHPAAVLIPDHPDYARELAAQQIDPPGPPSPPRPPFPIVG